MNSYSKGNGNSSSDSRKANDRNKKDDKSTKSSWGASGSSNSSQNKDNNKDNRDKMYFVATEGANAPQVYPSLYGQNSGPQVPQQMPQSYQPMAHYPHSMSAQMGQPLTSGMTQGLGPPPPYSPYSESQQQQMKYMSQMAYQNQYMAANSGSMGASQGMPQQQQSPLAGAHPHSYANPYQSNLYNPSLYNPYNPYSSLGSNPGGTVVMPHAFDAGARFDGLNRPVIPPPPPGVAANPAQMAALQGQNVVLGQKKNSFLEGGSSGGYTFW